MSVLKDTPGGWEKNHLHGSELTIELTEDLVGIVPVSASQTGKPNNPWGTEYSTQIGNASVVEN